MVQGRSLPQPPMGEVPVARDYGIEPVMGHEAEATTPVPAPATEQEKDLFKHLTRPADLYTDDGIYWADLPLRQRLAFVFKTDAAETKREFSSFLSMFRENALSPLSWYWTNAVLPGAGLGLEGYVLFSIGNLEPLYKAAWPSCWSDHVICTKNWIFAVTYLEIVGIMVGQIGVGIIGDWVGRRWGLIQDAVIMFVGLLWLTASWGVTLQGWVICYAWALFFYGFGVGGEYPITATASMENSVGAGKVSTRDDRLHRGRKVVMAFLMQGWGQFFNQVILIILLLIFNGGRGDGPYSVASAQGIFRIQFAITAIGTGWLVYHRIFNTKAANTQLDKTKKKANVTGYDVKSFKMTLTHFGGRLFAASMGWFCNDVFFYGNKLFQSQFIKVISANPSSIMTTWTWNLVNVAVSLVGYYLASFLIDNKIYGRKNMQQIGFLMCFIMFVVPAFNYDYYKSPAGIHAFQTMYFLSSFFNQFGPNAVTFLVAGEIFPTQIRASAHGFSACIGKSGALLASVLYNYIDTQTKFYVVPWFGLAGMLVTWLWLPDTTGLDLKEQERRWQYMLDGRAQHYHGIAIHPQHLSVWERIRGVGNSYHPDLDLSSKIQDIKTDWLEKEAVRQQTEAAEFEDLDDDYNDDIHRFFRGTLPNDEKHLKSVVTGVGSSSASEKS